MGEPYPNGRGRPARCRPMCSLLFAAGLSAVLTAGALGAPCVVPDDGTGTVTLPPPGCGYLSPSDVHMIIDGLPPGTTIEVGA